MGAHDEVDILSIRMSLKLQTKLIQIPNFHLRFICPRSDSGLAIWSGLDTIARFWEFETLDKLDCAFIVFFAGAFGAFVRGAFSR